MNNFKVTQLMPANGRKTFSGNALMITNGSVTELQSYETIVARYNSKTNTMLIKGWYSKSTAAHINAFLDYFGFDQMTKKEMLSMVTNF